MTTKVRFGVGGSLQPYAPSRPPYSHFLIENVVLTYVDPRDDGEPKRIEIDPSKHNAVCWSEQTIQILAWAIGYLRNHRDLCQELLGVDTPGDPGTERSPVVGPICVHDWSCSTQCW